MKRMWINQPSTLQPLHKLHGTRVLLDEEKKTIYLLKGDVISMMPPPNVLSEGWPKEGLVQAKDLLYTLRAYNYQNPNFEHDAALVADALKGGK